VTVRVGVIGTGWVGRARHIPGFRTHPQVVIAAVYDRRPDRAAGAARASGVPAWDDDLDRFLSRDLDIVSIATPPWTHAELARSALGRGLHVFTEKPMAMDLAEARSMVQAAEDAGRLLCVSHNFLYSRSVRKARAFLGADPDLRYVAGAQLSSLRRRLPSWHEELPGGLLFDEMPHLVYLLQHFLGAPLQVEHVRGARGATDAPVEVLLRGARGPGQITMVMDAPVSEWQVVVVAEHGTVVLDLFRDIAVRIRPDGAHEPLDILRTSATAMRDHAVGFVASGSRYVRGRLFWGHDELIGAFVEAAMTGGPSPVPAEEALGVVAVADRVAGALTRVAEP
jgi:predicted dehydrogenase